MPIPEVTVTRADMPTMYPSFRYDDAPAAIDWLVRAFGFKRHAVYPNPDGTIAHAELSLGRGMIMLGSTKADFMGMKSPRTLGAVTGGLYVVIDDVDAHCARATAAGAIIVRPLTDQSYGGRDYSCRDLEGNLWSFGTYVPEPTPVSTPG